MGQWKISNNYVILFKKSDFPLLNDGRNYETDETKWEYDESGALRYSPERLVKDAGYRTHLYQCYGKREGFGEISLVRPCEVEFRRPGQKDVRMYHLGDLIDEINEGSLDFCINDYYLYVGLKFYARTY